MHTIMYFSILVQTEKPKFLKKPTDVEVVETEDAMFEIEVDGKPKPEIQWCVINDHQLSSMPYGSIGIISLLIWHNFIHTGYLEIRSWNHQIRL